MKFALVGIGTRGDVQPYVCLGWELSRRGHEVTVVAPENMQTFVQRAGLRFATTGDDVESVLHQPEAVEMLATGKILRVMSWLGARSSELMEQRNENYRQATQDADLIVSHVLADEPLSALASARRIPLIPLYLSPLLRGSTHPPPLFFARSRGPLTPLLHVVAESLFKKSGVEAALEMRKYFGKELPKHGFRDQVLRKNLPALLSFSPAIVPRPKDYPPSVVSCPATTPTPALREALGESGLPDDLMNWINQGPPPFYMGLGSIPVLDPPRMLDMVRSALEMIDSRAVICAGWTRFAKNVDDERLRIVGEIDHAALMSRCSGAMHHGGAGTTYASLRAGLPTFVTSVFFDQPYWGARVVDLGLGTTTPFKRLTKKTLIRGLQFLRRPEVVERAREIGEILRLEDGACDLADTLERIGTDLPCPD